MTAVEIRRLSPADGDAIFALVHSDPPEYRRHFHAIDADIGAAISAAAHDGYWGLIADGALVGIMMLRGLDAGFAAPAFGVYVSQAWSRRGLAQQALAHAEAWCRANGISELMLTVDPANDVALRLYERSGFAFNDEHSARGHRIYRKPLGAVTLPVYVSTTSFRDRDLRSILSACATHGIEALELSAVEGYDPAILDSQDRPRHLLVHNYFPPPAEPFVLNLASQDSEILERSRMHCRAAIDLSRTLGGPIFAAHAGFRADVGPNLLGRPELQSALPIDMLAPAELTHETLVESARGLAQHAHTRGVRFLIENHVLPAAAGETGRRLLPMTTASELARLAEDVGHPGFGLLVDVGHLKVSAATLGFDPNEFLDAVAPWVAAFHLSDNDGSADTHMPFGDDAWFRPRLADHPAAVLTVELVGCVADELVAARDTVGRWR